MDLNNNIYMISNKLKQRVLEEATLLKQFATKEELSELDECTIDPGRVESCIYGQMTGDCYSIRAHELLEKCAIRPYSTSLLRYRRTNLKENWLKKRSDEGFFFSPIEYYIYHSPKNIYKIVEFLLDKSTLTVKDL